MRHALALALVLLAACEPGSRSRELYVSMPAENAVIRVDPVGQRIVSRTTVGLLPHNFAFSADQRRLYVVLVGSQAVAELDSPSGALLRTILTEPVPSARADGTTIQEHIDQGAFSATTCFACHHGGAGGAKTTVVGSRPFGIVLGPDEQTLYVTNIVSGNLSSIDLASGRSTVTHLAATGDAQQPTAIALLGDDLFVTVLPVLPSFSPAVVRRLDRTTLATRAEAPTGSNSNALLADALHDELYVSNFESNTLSRFDRELAVLGKITVGDGPLGQLLLDREHLLVADYYANSLSTVDLVRGEASAPRPLAFAERPMVNPTHAVVSDDGATAYVVSSGTVGNLLAVDLRSFETRAAIPIGALPFDVTFVPLTSP